MATQVEHRKLWDLVSEAVGYSHGIGPTACDAILAEFPNPTLDTPPIRRMVDVLLQNRIALHADWDETLQNDARVKLKLDNILPKAKARFGAEVVGKLLVEAVRRGKLKPDKAKALVTNHLPELVTK